MAWTEFGTVKSPDQRQARVRQTRMNALADRPDLSFAGQSREGLDRIIGHHVVELPHQSLVGPENDRADRTRIGLVLSVSAIAACRLAFPKARAQPQLHGPIIVGQRAHRFLVLPDARCGQGFHRADDGLEIAGTADLSAQALRGVAHDLSLASAVSVFGSSGSDPIRLSGFRLGLERNERLAGDFDDRIAILIAQLVGAFESRAHLRRDVRRRLLDGVLGVRHLVERRRGRRVPRSMPVRRRFVRARTPVRIPPV